MLKVSSSKKTGLGPVCLFLPSLAGGGAERVFVTIANSLTQNNVIVDLVVANDKYLDYLSEVNEDVNLIILGSKRTLASTPRLVRYLKINRPVAIMTTMSHANLVGKLALIFSGSKSTNHIIRQAIAPGAMPFKNKLVDIAANAMLRYTYRTAQKVISISEEMMPLICEHYGISSNVCTIYNPIPASKLEQLSKQAPEIDIPWNDTYKVLLIAIGRLSDQKDFQTLIHAFSKIHKKLDARLIILGEGPERDNLECLIQSNGLSSYVWMPGFVVNPFPYVRIADVFVLSSKFEGLPNALIQSLILGKLCVATKCQTGPGEILEDGKLGELVDVGNPVQMADAIVNVMSVVAFKKSNIDGIKEKYSVRQITKKYIDVLIPDIEKHTS